ncbi:hypothetical protein EHI8A_037170 [Entamoeba histolytica HM-1:IMSS-B]|uniref:BZIP domain-containing protein n=6 Tax=Entamoeba histolytica TaxID=5759 RepID=C4M1Z9_ENTH1|nr:hypothetical protein EHI_165180 [Entamoeba histolytica HM-1:IMSS]EMD42408.1 Hypothetical protein EHI5A_069510 [Entamoeba histolytica KU27]EMH77752.1 hypothetical protein EHI8A_037170 [Entamoeba histolytica HM-1:IMSS-B]EMS12357.1 hypothetical protein KM1_080620 [Entamoeba histolytica HM-3:IMSS]ENY60123.1 hypothetical protein EHI7A_038260 [Entamoeba histolytica HM-1:IMSS-A]GAT95273.1 hypothetical protein CL6EHI_165180 [Entamoeba histolytica]|eukprot:XP_652228.1 hypothetical protein EHI_165180 [Entamoeba histolytica HM-1:IMSS]
MSKAVPYNPFNVHTKNFSGKRLSPRESSKKEVKPKSPFKKEINWTLLEKLDLKEFDKEVERIKSRNELRSNDELQIKKLRRKIQNRWSSKCSREKKKDKFIEIQQELIKYKQKCISLEQENKRLKLLIEKSSSFSEPLLSNKNKFNSQ